MQMNLILLSYQMLRNLAVYAVFKHKPSSQTYNCTVPLSIYYLYEPNSCGIFIVLCQLRLSHLYSFYFAFFCKSPSCVRACVRA